MRGFLATLAVLRMGVPSLGFLRNTACIPALTIALPLRLAVCHCFALSYPPIRANNWLTEPANHCPPRGVAIWRALSSSAMARRLVFPAARSSRTIGGGPILACRGEIDVITFRLCVSYVTQGGLRFRYFLNQPLRFRSGQIQKGEVTQEFS